MHCAMKKACRYKFLVENLPWTVDTKELKSYFIRFGEIHSAWVNFNKSTGFSQGTGFVSYTGSRKVDLLAETHIIHGETVKITKVED